MSKAVAGCLLSYEDLQHTHLAQNFLFGEANHSGFRLTIDSSLDETALSGYLEQTYSNCFASFTFSFHLSPHFCSSLGSFEHPLV